MTRTPDDIREAKRQWAKENRPSRAKVIPERTCEHCGETFTPKRSDARFCSSKCRVYARRGVKQPSPEPQRKKPVTPEQVEPDWDQVALHLDKMPAGLKRKLGAGTAKPGVTGNRNASKIELQLRKQNDVLINNNRGLTMQNDMLTSKIQMLKDEYATTSTGELAAELEKVEGKLKNATSKLRAAERQARADVNERMPDEIVKAWEKLKKDREKMKQAQIAASNFAKLLKQTDPKDIKWLQGFLHHDKHPGEDPEGFNKAFDLFRKMTGK